MRLLTAPTDTCSFLMLLGGSSGSGHVGLLPGGQRGLRLFDRLEGGKFEDVVGSTRLVVRSGQSQAPEGLLADDGSGAGVVYVEVAGRILQHFRGCVHEAFVLGEDGSCGGERLCHRECNGRIFLI